MTSTVSTMEGLGGYDATFVNELPDSYTCPICHLGMKEPQLTLCGHQFCGCCLGPLVRNGKLSCPVCRTELTDAQIFPNNALKREVLNLKIRCVLHQEGCGWVAELSQREAHRAKCQFVTVSCSKECGVLIRRKDVADHQSSECRLRDVACPNCREVVKFQDLDDHLEQSCEYVPRPCSNGCGQMVSRRDVAKHGLTCSCAVVSCSNDCGANITRKHLHMHLHAKCERRTVACRYCKKEMEQWKVQGHINSCLEYAIPCVNRCGKQVIRCKMSLHVSRQGTCQSSPLQCDFNNCGCDFRGNRRELANHLLTDNSKHFSLAMNVIRTKEKELRSVKACLTRRESELESIKAEFGSRLPEWKSPEPTEFVYLWKIDGWSSKLKEARSGAVTRLTSESLYTDHPGYRIFFGLFPNGLGLHRGSHVSFSPYLATGQYDEELMWPVWGLFKITVIDQQPDGVDHSVVYEKHCRPGASYLGGISDYIRHSDLASRLFLKNDSILFKLCVTFERQ